MIEFCTVKRMVVVVAALVILCVIFLGVENALTEDHRKSLAEQANLTGKDACWKTENYSVKEECKECSSFERVSGHLPICLVSGYRELVTCAKSGDVYKSCPRLPWLEKRNFWLFESATFLTGLLSWTAVYLRQKQLDHQTLQRINKQIAAGV